jgi:molybdopterin molybdotransferase
VISVAEAIRQVLETAHPFEVVTVPLDQALGCVLRAPVQADRDFPPFDRVTMDGIAIAYAAFAAGRRGFQVQSLQQAGMPQQTLGSPEQCIEVMTGAQMPLGADTVIRYEDVNLAHGEATVSVEGVTLHQNVHDQGTDRQAGQRLIAPGCLIGAPEIAVAASVGHAQLAVSRRPRVVILSTGDELVPVEATPGPQQIRRSNGHLLQATLAPYVAEAVSMHLKDDKALIRERVREALATYDVVLLSGGVSMGKADFIPAVMEELGVNRLFHRIQQRPGKPLWFGLWQGQVPIFALPGNPVSTFVGCIRYVLPWLRRSLCYPEPPPTFATLTEDYSFAAPLTYFLQIRLAPNDQGHLLATPVPGHGSGDFANLLDANAVMELPAEQDHFRAGDRYQVFPFRSYPPFTQ